MSDDNHRWTVGSPPPIIRPHSLAKHRVIEGYLLRYVQTLTSNPRQPLLRLTIVDGFAGGGEYRDFSTNEIRPGSPLIALNTMRDVERSTQQSRVNPFHLDVEYFFIEKRKATYEYLKSTLEQSDHSRKVGDEVHIFNSGLDSQIDDILTRIRSRGGGQRAIFLLDQFGISSVDFGMIRKILQLKNAEIILTFATDSLIDYLNASVEVQERLKRIGLTLPSEKIVEHKQHSQWRRLIQNELHEEIFRKSGAQHYTPFFIRSKDAHRDYWLVHLSGHARARDVMVGLHWQENTCFAHYGRAGLHMLGYDQDEDPQVTGQLLLPNFYFDETAQSLSINTLLEQFPDVIDRYRSGIDFMSFFADWTNSSPATSDIFKETLRRLAAERIIRITDKTGAINRQNGIQSIHDVIKRTRVKRLFS